MSTGRTQFRHADDLQKHVSSELDNEVQHTDDFILC